MFAVFNNISIINISLFIVLAISNIEVVSAQETDGPYRSSNLRDACISSIDNSRTYFVDKAAAEGACGAAISTVFRFAYAMNDQYRFCPPPSITNQQVIPIIIKFIDNNPKALTMDIRDVANYVGRLNYPCPK